MKEEFSDVEEDAAKKLAVKTKESIHTHAYTISLATENKVLTLADEGQNVEQRLTLEELMESGYKELMRKRETAG